MKIYTGTGDQGETGLLGGVRVSKDHPAVHSCGELDETNSLIGLAIASLNDADVRKMLEEIQRDLFVLGSQLAQSQVDSARAATLTLGRHEWLERAIDRFSEGLPEMTAFILPGGGSAGATLHVARCVCRRAERSVVALQQTDGLKQDLSDVLVYLNRLSDLLFVLARRCNLADGVAEQKWLP